MILSINSSYMVTTVQETIINKKIKVVSIINYDETQRVPFNLMGLVNNELVVETESDTLEKLQGLSYYKCELIGSPGEYIILWDDIINRDSLTPLSDTFDMALTIKLDIDKLDFNLEDIKTAILKVAEQDKFKDKLSLSLTSLNTISSPSFNTIEEERAMYKELLEEYKNVSEGNINFYNKTSALITKLDALGLTTNLEGIGALSQDIYDLLQIIEARLS